MLVFTDSCHCLVGSLSRPQYVDNVTVVTVVAASDDAFHLDSLEKHPRNYE